MSLCLIKEAGLYFAFEKVSLAFTKDVEKETCSGFQN